MQKPTQKTESTATAKYHTREKSLSPLFGGPLKAQPEAEKLRQPSKNNLSPLLGGVLNRQLTSIRTEQSSVKSLSPLFGGFLKAQPEAEKPNQPSKKHLGSLFCGFLKAQPEAEKPNQPSKKHLGSLFGGFLKAQPEAEKPNQPSKKHLGSLFGGFFRVPSAGSEATEAGRKKIHRKGFTLIELIIVIAILSILATVSFTTYSETRKSAEISLQTDSIIAKLREAKGESQNVQKDEEDKNVYCIGFKFTKAESSKDSIQRIKIPYQNRFTPCSTDTPINNKKLEPIIDNQLNITDIKIQTTVTPTPTSVDEFTILYYPPKGEFLMQSNNNDSITEVIIETALKDRQSPAVIKILNSGVIQKELKSSQSDNE
jgi:prepilin-type N-terminal cleavage/methylation domain-containing protein